MKRLTLLGKACLPACFCIALSQLSAQNLPPVAISSNAPFCEGVSPLNLYESGGAALIWSWSGPNGFVSSQQNPVIPAPGSAWSGNYSVTITDAAGLQNEATLNVQIYSIPVVSAADAAICAGSSVTLSAGGGTSCFWQPITGLSDPASCTPVAGPASTITYFVKVTDANGCVATEPVQVLVHQPGPLVCNDNVLISLDASGLVEITPDMVLEGSDPDAGFFTVNISSNTGANLGNTIGCAQIGQVLTVKITDICNGSSCWGNLKVEDKLDPLVTCTDIFLPCAVQTYTPGYLLNTLGIATAFPAVVENCGSYTQQFADTWHNLNCDESINGLSDLSAYLERKWTVADAQGNVSTCTQFIYSKRLHISDLSLPPAVTVSCTTPNISPTVTGAPYILVNNVKFTLYPSVAFCELNAVFTDEIFPVCDGSYKILRNWVFYDWCLPTSATPPFNPLIYKQLIKVTDNAGPVMICPANLTVGANPFACCSTVDLPDMQLSDNCSRLNNISAILASYDYNTDTLAAIFSLEGVLSDFEGNNFWIPDTLGSFGFTPCLPIGEHVVTYRAEDDCGNTSTCTYQLTVADLTPPSVACDEFTQVALTSSGKAEVYALTFDDGSFDLCCLDTFEARRMNADCNGAQDDFGPLVVFCCSDIGDTVPVILRVHDCHGNTNDCMVQVFVEDKIKPICTPPANTTVSCENFDPSFGIYGIATGTDNCCIDTITASANYNLFDTVCNLGTIIRTFRVFDCTGNSSQCTQRIVVFYKQDYFLKMPNDVNLSKCDGTGNYGAPSFFGEDCELLGVAYEDVVFTVVPDACYKIERTWKIINWCTYNPGGACIAVPNPNPSANLNDPNNIRGPILSPFGTSAPWSSTLTNLTPGSTTPTDFSQFYNPNANCYTYTQIIKITDMQDPVVHAPAGPVEYCDISANDGALWNASYWWDNTISSHNLCEGPTDLSITAIDSCTGTRLSFSVLLFLDMDGDGVRETVVNSLDLSTPGAVRFGNAATPNFAGGVLREFDHRSVPANAKYNFSVQTEIVGGLVQASLRWNTQANPSQYIVPELPYGNHRIEWIVEDDCGNQTTRSYEFRVKDCKAPTAVCINGLSVNIMPIGMITLWASDFLQYADDNCTLANQLKLAIRKSGTGAGFPVDAAGNPQTSVTFNCAELGTQAVELWAQDLAGNADFCETYVLVQDNMSVCPTVVATVAGALRTEAADGLEAANVDISGVSDLVPSFSAITQSNDEGAYSFNNIPLTANYTVTPEKDDNPLNGVTTYDLVLISKHILGLEPLNSPYKMIAADANKNGSITTFDIVELRKLILGIYPELPSNTSWRFVDKKFAFFNLNNPFQLPFPENKSVNNFQQTTPAADFIAVKIGDVNGTALPNSLMQSDARTAATVLFEVDMAGTAFAEVSTVKSGETVLVPIRAAGEAEAFQFTLLVDPMEVLEIIPGAGMSAENFALFPEEHALTVSWFKSPDQAKLPEFTLRLRAKTSGKLSQMLRLSSRITAAEAYTSQPGSAPQRSDIALRFHSNMVSTVAGPGFELYQNQPNPFLHKTRIGFYLPESGEATLSILDGMGRMLLTRTGVFSKGNNFMEIDRSALGASAAGGWYYKVDTVSGSATKKMLVGE